MKLSKRSFLLGSVAVAATLMVSHEAVAGSGCAVGAIRWDAQYCNTLGQPCFEEEASLSPSKWQFRAPLHAQVTGPNQLTFSPTQTTFDAEITAAKNGGLSYWAYLLYANSSGVIDLTNSMNQGLVLHRASTIKSQMKWAAIVASNCMGATGNFSAAVAEIVSLMQDSNYQTCLSGRPVLYIYYSASDLTGYWGGSYANMQASLNAIRSGVQSAGLGNPYVIVMGAEAVRVGLAADAISQYSTGVPNTTNSTYPQLDTIAQATWASELASTAGGVIPTVMIGWDTRPRRERPPFWEIAGSHPRMGLSGYTSAPTPAQFAAECQAAVTFVNANPTACVSKLILIYAWNEDSEGGPLEPSLGDVSASKLTAAAPIITP